MSAAPAPRSRLYSRWDHSSAGSDTLLVYFNGYGSPARGVKTHLDGFGGLSAFGTSTLWFAESGEYGWYTDFDSRIQATIRFAAQQPGIRQLLLMGSSAGGYAAIRHAALLHDIDAGVVSIRALAVNPQSAFDDTTLAGIRQRLAAAGWPADELGRDPIVPLRGRIDGASLLGDAALPALLALPRQHSERITFDVHYDAGNPIDSGFAEALAGAARLHPQPLGLPHRLGSGALLKSDAVRAAVERVLAPPPPAPVAKKAYLALFRSGPGSLHTTAVRRLAAQNYDYALSHQGDGDPPSVGAVFVDRQPGAKWPALARTLRAHWDLVRQYRQVWLADDDLLCDPEVLSRLFAACDEQRLEHALPRVTPPSARDAGVPVVATERLAQWLPLLDAGPPPGLPAPIEGITFRRIDGLDDPAPPPVAQEIPAFRALAAGAAA